MINTHILNLKQEVPKEIRLEVYIKAVEYINNPIQTKGFGLCIILPVLLWDLNTFIAASPDGNDWSYQETCKAFPELTDEVLETLFHTHTTKERKIKRLEYLEQFIKQLT